jgi:hypothetical protein
VKTNSAPQFLDDVVDEMGDGKGGSDYGVDMEKEPDGDEGDDESQNEDRMMAFKSLSKALGLSSVDPQKGADALKAFIATCQ